MRKPCERDDPSLSSIRAYKGVVLTDDRRSTVHDYLDLSEIGGISDDE